MEDLNAAAPSSTEPSAEQLAAIAMGTNTQAPQEDGAAAVGETTGNQAIPSGTGSAATDAAAPTTSTTAAQASAETAASTTATPSGDAGNGTGVPASSCAPSTESPSGSAPAGDAGNDGANAADLPPSTSDAGSSLPPLSPQVPLTGSDGGDAPKIHSDLDGAIGDAILTGTGYYRIGGEDPNAGASAAAAVFASDTQSSVNLASQPGVTLAASAFVAERIRASLQVIREHLWTFERAAVEHLHAELDAIERLL